MYMRKARILFILLLSATCSFGQARPPSGGPPIPELTPAQIHTVIDSLCSRLKQAYIFPDTAVKMAQYLQAQYKKGVYANYKDPNQLAARLAGDLQAAHHDDHLRVMSLPPHPEPRRTDTTGAAQWEKEENARRLAEAQAANFSFVRAEVLTGNIGYIRFDGFTGNVDEATPTVASALRFVANTRALIIDLRSNGGGSPWMVTRIESFFFPERTHMNDIVSRDEATIEMWTDPAKAEGLIFSKPVYILACRGTHSAAEDFTYGMQSVHRAVVVGETTIGGAHPTRDFDIAFGIFAAIPGSRSLNPYTHTDWEGTGVRPDLPAPLDKALEAAESAIFTHELQQAGTDEEKGQVQWQLNKFKAAHTTATADSSALAAYTGVYEGGLDFYIRGRDLYCRNPERGGGEFKLQYFAPDQFVLDENVQLEFTHNPAGKVEGFRMHWSNGRISYKARNM
jgi:hypothetical protein